MAIQIICLQGWSCTGRGKEPGFEEAILEAGAPVADLALGQSWSHRQPRG